MKKYINSPLFSNYFCLLSISNTVRHDTIMLDTRVIVHPGLLD